MQLTSVASEIKIACRDLKERHCAGKSSDRYFTAEN